MAVRGAPEGYRGLGITDGALVYVRSERSLADGSSLMVGFGWDPARLSQTDPAAMTRHLREFLPDAVVTAPSLAPNTRACALSLGW